MSKKILIIRFSSIGDIILTTPVIRAMRQQVNAEVHFLTKPSFASLLSTNPYIAKVITLSDNFDETVMLLKNEAYDFIIDLHHNLRTKRIKLALDVKTKSFHKLNFEKWLMVNFKINRLPKKHIVDRYLDTVSFMGVKNDENGLDFIIPPEKIINTSVRFGFEKHMYAAIVIGAAHATKCMSVEQIATLCNYLVMPVVLLGGKQEIEKANSVIGLSNSDLIKSACGDFDIYESSSILFQAGTIITHDTGLMHIASALKKPQVVVWGNTIPEFGMTPYYGNADIKWKSFEQKGLYCRPCSKLGYQECPQKHFRCMLDHDLRNIAEAAREIMKTTHLA